MKSIVFKGLLLVSFFSLTALQNLQETSTFTGSYDGHEDYGYNFIGEYDDGSEYTMTFHKIDPKVADSFDFDSDVLLGKDFEVTYKTEIKTFKDEDGFDDEKEIITILAVKSL